MAGYNSRRGALVAVVLDAVFDTPIIVSYRICLPPFPYSSSHVCGDAFRWYRTVKSETNSLEVLDGPLGWWFGWGLHIFYHVFNLPEPDLQGSLHGDPCLFPLPLHV